MIQIHCLRCGSVGVDPAVPARSVSKNPLAYTGLFRSPKRRIWLPVKAFYIDHPKGKILVDTAWDEAVREHPIRALTFPLWFASKPRLPAGQSVREQLAALGVRPEELDYVLMTHMDIDHDSGLKLVRGAKRILVSEGEWQAIHSHDVRYARGIWEGVPLEVMPLAPDPAAPCGAAWDIFGDGSVRVLSMPGHSRGSVVVQVTGADGFALIVGDTGYTPASWDALELPGPVYDKAAMRAALAWVRDQRNRPDCRAVLAAHDAAQTDTVIEL